jgi:hypothetical protein
MYRPSFKLPVEDLKGDWTRYQLHWKSWHNSSLTPRSINLYSYPFNLNELKIVLSWSKQDDYCTYLINQPWILLRQIVRVQNDSYVDRTRVGIGYIMLDGAWRENHRRKTYLKLENNLRIETRWTSICNPPSIRSVCDDENLELVQRYLGNVS